MAQIYGDKEQLSDQCLRIANEILNYTSSRDDVHCYFRYPIVKEKDTFKTLKLLIVSKSGIFNICENDEDKKQFLINVFPKIMSIPSLFERYSNDSQIFRNIMITEYDGVHLFDDEDKLTYKELKEFEVAFQNAQSLNIITSKDDAPENTLGHLICLRSKNINTFSAGQFSYITEDSYNTNYRIRGLAGSGKTIIMVKRMAYMHYKHPDLSMAFVFYTVSLKQTITNMFKSFYKEFSSTEDYDTNKIFFLHAWGSSSTPGFYSNICDRVNAQREPYEYDSFNRNTLGAVCERLLEKMGPNHLSLFDYVFIDEAQDFSINFFRLVMKSLTPIGGISYAYDELQTLSFSSGIPSKSDIFGSKAVKDVNLDICYRTPKEILVTAHAFGMGIYRDDYSNSLPVNIPQDTSIWKAIGYNSTPKLFKYGDNVIFSRDEAFSNPFIDKEPIIIKEFENKNEEFIEVYQNIKKMIKNEAVSPEDLLIIDLDANNYESDYQDFRSICLSRLRMGNENLEDPLFNIHLLGKNDRYYFKKTGSIPFTSVFRAKGNEANIVFVINANNMTSLQSFMRNRLFTAMTRAKFKVFVFGCQGMERFANEYAKVQENNYSLVFTYPTKEELNKIQKIAREEEGNANAITNVKENVEKLKMKDIKAYYEMLVSVHGKLIADKIISLENDENKE